MLESFQHKQTREFFEKFSKQWSKNAKEDYSDFVNTIKIRNDYVEKICRKFVKKKSKTLDVGCGTGDLVIKLSKNGFDSEGVDFASSMIDIAKKDAKKHKISEEKFSNKSFFEYTPKNKLDLISANGFIEYISEKELEEFINKSYNFLNKDGYLVFESRNRLFNCFSFNQYTEGEIEINEISNLLRECILFNQSDKVTSFYMVLHGKVKLFRISPDGQEKIIEIVKAGEVFAEALMFSNQTDYPVSSAALGESIVISINAKDFQEMLWDSTGTCLLLLGDMSLRLRKLINEIDTLTLQSGTCRIANYLLQEMPEGQSEFKLEMAKNIIAARLSIKPETFSRIIKSLKDLGVLSIDSNNVTIHNIATLKKMSII